MPIDRLPGLYDPKSVRGWRFMKAAQYFVLGTVALIWFLFNRPESGADLQKPRRPG